MNVAVIPARGGSQRIERKNIRPFNGRPMIAHSIDAALQSGLFDRVIVSTDDQDIAAVAVASGAEVPFMRPAELAGHYTGTTPVVAHAVRWLHDENRASPAAVCCLYATAPFVTAGDLAAGLAQLKTGRWQFVFSAFESPGPVARCFTLGGDDEVAMMFPEHFNTRSQDLPTALFDAGMFYWGTPEAWLADAPLFGPGATVVKIPPWRVQDIDTEDDWQRAEILQQVLQARAAAGAP